jgi:acyl-CoA thioester hydrolase
MVGWECPIKPREASGLDPEAVHGEYVTFQDETFSQFLRAMGRPWESDGLDFHVVHAAVDYHDTARFGDDLTNGIRAASIGDSSVDFRWACRRREDDAVVATGALSHVAVDGEGGDPIRIPDGFRDAVRAYQDVPPSTD